MKREEAKEWTSFVLGAGIGAASTLLIFGIIEIFGMMI